MIASMYKFMKMASKCGTETRCHVFILDFRALISLTSVGKYKRDFQKFEVIISSDWAMRHHKLFPSLRLIMLDNLRSTEESGLDSEALTVYQSERLDAKPYIHLMSFDGVDINTIPYLEASATRDLLYLDLSHALRPGSWAVVIRDVPFPNLKVLLLKGMGLTTGTFPVHFLEESNLYLWSLNVQDNNLKDDFIRIILAHGGFLKKNNLLHTQARHAHPDEEFTFDYPPYYTNDGQLLSHPPFSSLVPLRDDTLDGFALHLQNATNGWTGEIKADDIYLRRTGITHLYLSNNDFTSDAIHYLFQIENNHLQVLDISSLQIKPQNRIRVFDSKLPNPRLLFHKDCVPYGVINCTSYFSRYSATGSRVESLRIHHSFVTRIPTLVKDSLKDGFLLDRLEEAETPTPQYIIDMAEEFQEGFEPGYNNGLRELSLTDIPTMSYGPTISALIALIEQCQRQEDGLNQARAKTHRRSPPVMPGLRVLTLEFIKPMNLPEDQGDFSFFASGSGSSDPPALAVPAVSANPPSYDSIEKELAGLTLNKEGPADVITALKEFRRSHLPKWGGKLVIVL